MRAVWRAQNHRASSYSASDKAKIAHALIRAPPWWCAKRRWKCYKRPGSPSCHHQTVLNSSKVHFNSKSSRKYPTKPRWVARLVEQVSMKTIYIPKQVLILQIKHLQTASARPPSAATTAPAASSASAPARTDPRTSAVPTRTKN